jgi:hypothetical protein
MRNGMPYYFHSNEELHSISCTVHFELLHLFFYSFWFVFAFAQLLEWHAFPGPFHLLAITILNSWP